jgi:cysteine desulfurase
MEDYAEVCERRGACLVVDASQAFGKVPAVAALGDALVVAAHKVGGPAGAGALWVRRTRPLEPLLRGGSQERGRRPGAPDVLAHVGFGAACDVLPERLAALPRLAALGARLADGAVAQGGVLNGGEGPRVPTAVNVSFRGAKGAELVAALDLEGVAVASGAACSSGVTGPSPVLLAMHRDEPWRASSALRLSLGPETTERDIRAALTALEKVMARVR